MKMINRLGLAFTIFGFTLTILWHMNHSYVFGGSLTCLFFAGLGMALLVGEY